MELQKILLLKEADTPSNPGFIFIVFHSNHFTATQAGKIGYRHGARLPLIPNEKNPDFGFYQPIRSLKGS
jgi:hypothetical protein